MKILSLIAGASVEFKGIAGTLAALSLADWSSIASVAAGVATVVYMIRKTYLLRAPIPADICDECDKPKSRCTCHV